MKRLTGVFALMLLGAISMASARSQGGIRVHAQLVDEGQVVKTAGVPIQCRVGGDNMAYSEKIVATAVTDGSGMATLIYEIPNPGPQPYRAFAECHVVRDDADIKAQAVQGFEQYVRPVNAWVDVTVNVPVLP